MATCPNGHTSEWADFCSVCGASIGGASNAAPASAPSANAAPASTTAPASAPASSTPAVAPPVTNAGTCPACGAACEPTDVFCEACGADLLTAEAAPAPAVTGTSAVAVTDVFVEVSVDRDYFDRYVEGELSFPDPVPATVRVPVVKPELLVGRRSESRGVFPDIDGQLLTADPAVSHKHALLQCDTTGAWTVTDQGSTNGSRLDDVLELLAPGRAYPLPAGSVLHVGAWTSIRVIDEGIAPPAP